MRWKYPLMFIAALMTGCVQTEKRTPATQPSAREFFLGRRQVEQPPADTLIWRGTLPCLEHFMPGGQLQLTDITDRVVLWSGQVEPGSLIRVDASGVTIGSRRAYARRLNPEHQYELWFLP